MRRKVRITRACPRCTWPIDVPGVHDLSICYRCEVKALGLPAGSRPGAPAPRVPGPNPQRMAAQRALIERDRVRELVQHLRQEVKWKDQRSRMHEAEAAAATSAESAAVGWTRCATAALESAAACDLLAAKGEPKDRAHSLRCAQGRRERAASALEQALKLGAQAVAAARPAVLAGEALASSPPAGQLRVVPKEGA